MDSRLRTVFVAFIILISITIAAAPAQTAKRLPNRPSRHPVYTQTDWGVLYAYGLAPCLYYKTYGFNGIQGAPNASPLQFGSGESTFGSSDFAFGSSTFEY